MYQHGRQCGLHSSLAHSGIGIMYTTPHHALPTVSMASGCIQARYQLDGGELIRIFIGERVLMVAMLDLAQHATSVTKMMLCRNTGSNWQER